MGKGAEPEVALRHVAGNSCRGLRAARQDTAHESPGGAGLVILGKLSSWLAPACGPEEQPLGQLGVAQIARDCEQRAVAGAIWAWRFATSVRAKGKSRTAGRWEKPTPHGQTAFRGARRLVWPCHPRLALCPALPGNHHARFALRPTVHTGGVKLQLSRAPARDASGAGGCDARSTEEREHHPPGVNSCRGHGRKARAGRATSSTARESNRAVALGTGVGPRHRRGLISHGTAVRGHLGAEPRRLPSIPAAGEGVSKRS